MTAAEIAELSGIPERVIVEKFGLRGKHIAAPDEHVSDLSVKADRTPARRDRLRSGADRRRHVLRLDVARPRRLAGGAAHRPSRSAPPTPSRWSTTTSRTARRSHCASRATCLRAEPELAKRPRRRRLPRVVSPRLREREVAVHVQLRRRRRCGAPRRRLRAQRGARLARDHERRVLAAGEGRRRRLGRA